jgi:hypothetical protein
VVITFIVVDSILEMTSEQVLVEQFSDLSSGNLKATISCAVDDF